ncbi:MAG TPA: hypothetical protein DDY21_04335 [Candidatus Moranbacteria bacterium]|nr:hypothetical protein [Candidatus Moranbacteria bacterium]HCO99425.1 hypothetical protein [Candidatus Moranbacteria bacterium]
MSAFYYCRLNDPLFQGISTILGPTIDSTITSEVKSQMRLVWLLYKVTSEIPTVFFKDPIYTEQVFKSLEYYLAFNDIHCIKEISRKRKTDRLEPIRAIACDIFEYLSFLPMQLNKDFLICKNTLDTWTTLSGF